jgi:hypothetical protein
MGASVNERGVLFWTQAIGFEEHEIFEAFLRLPVPQRRVVREVIVAFDRAYGGRGGAGGRPRRLPGERQNGN